MGWNSSPDVNTKNELIEHLKTRSQPFNVLDCKSVLTGIWMLFENQKNGEKFITFFMIDATEHPFTFKAISEDQGPVQCDCPLSFVKQSTCNDEMAIAWRQKVRDYHAEKKQKKELAKAGAVIQYGGQLYKLCRKRTTASWSCNKLDALDKQPLPGFHLISTRQLNQATYL